MPGAAAAAAPPPPAAAAFAAKKHVPGQSSFTGSEAQSLTVFPEQEASSQVSVFLVSGQSPFASAPAAAFNSVSHVEAQFKM